MSATQEKTPEEELDSILNGLRKRQRVARKRATLLATIPIVIAILLFSYVSLAAAQYQRSTAILARDLNYEKEQTRHYKEVLAQYDQPPGEIKDVLNQYEESAKKLDEALGRVSDFQISLDQGNQKIGSQLSFLEKSSLTFGSIGIEGQPVPEDEQLYREFFDYINGKRSAPPSKLPPQVIARIMSSYKAYREGVVSATKEAQRYQLSNLETHQKLKSAIEESRKNETELITDSQKIVEYCKRVARPK